MKNTTKEIKTTTNGVEPKRFIKVKHGYDSNFGYEMLTEDLNEMLIEYEKEKKILHIENVNRDYRNVFNNKYKTYGYKFLYENLYYEVEAENGINCIEDLNEDYEEDLELIKEKEKNIKKLDYVEIEARGYSQGDWDTYYIVFDNTKTTAKEVENDFKNLQYLFTTMEYNAVLYENQKIEIHNKTTGEITKTEEPQEIDSISICDYGDLTREEIEQEAKSYLGNYDVESDF